MVGTDHKPAGGLSVASKPRLDVLAADAPDLHHDTASVPIQGIRRTAPLSPDAAAARAQLDAADLARLADEVIRRIDKRERIARERAGR